eukprot:m.231454 g.231454  ORF g.231454 m.231454 type:complete len:456 (+) comp19267_c0_seq14:191-1558(+)
MSGPETEGVVDKTPAPGSVDDDGKSPSVDNDAFAATHDATEDSGPPQPTSKTKKGRFHKAATREEQEEILGNLHNLKGVLIDNVGWKDIEIDGKGRQGGFNNNDAFQKSTPRSYLHPLNPGQRRSKDLYVPHTDVEVHDEVDDGSTLFVVDIPGARIRDLRQQYCCWGIFQSCSTCCLCFNLNECCLRDPILEPIFGDGKTTTATRLSLNQTPNSVQISIDEYRIGDNGMGNGLPTNDQKLQMQFGEAVPDIMEHISSITFNADNVLRCQLEQDYHSVAQGHRYIPCPPCCMKQIGPCRPLAPIVACCRAYPLRELSWIRCLTPYKYTNTWDLCCRSYFPPVCWRSLCPPKLGMWRNCCYSKRSVSESYENSYALSMILKGSSRIGPLLWSTMRNDATEFDVRYTIHPELAPICEDRSSVGKTVMNVIQYCSTGNSVLHSNYIAPRKSKTIHSSA